MIKQKLQQAIGEVLAQLKIEVGDFGVEYPDDFSHGDLTTNAAMVHAKISKQNPKALAGQIVEKLESARAAGKLSEVEKIEIAGAGFINFYLTREFFAKNILEIVKEGSDFGKNHLHKDQKIMIEHTNLNPFKPFHIGHLVNHSVGEAISRLLENGGAEVKRVSYGGDIGLHVAKSVWGMMHEKYDGKEKAITYLGRVYAQGATAYEEDKTAEQEIKEINKKIYDRSDKKINELYDWGKAESLKYFEKVYDMLGVKFAFQFFESEMASIGLFLVEEFLAKGVFEKSEGAVVFKGEKYGLHTRVFVNSQGLPTYEAKDLGLVKRKLESYDFDLSIVVTANEQNDYFKVLLKVFEFVFPSVANKMRHISHGFLRLTEGKMSSRTGKVITGESLISDIEKLVDEKLADREFSADMKKDIRDKVALAAIKYTILKQSPGSDIIFDLKKSVSFEGDSGPYLQYSVVRAHSVLHKAQEEKIAQFSGKNKIPAEVSELEKLLARFSGIVERATLELAPQKIVTHLLELSSAFNAYYANNKIVDLKDEYSPYKVALTESFAEIMSHGLSLLGIKVPEKM